MFINYALIFISGAKTGTHTHTPYNSGTVQCTYDAHHTTVLPVVRDMWLPVFMLAAHITTTNEGRATFSYVVPLKCRAAIKVNYWFAVACISEYSRSLSGPWWQGDSNSVTVFTETVDREKSRCHARRGPFIVPLSRRVATAACWCTVSLLSVTGRSHLLSYVCISASGKEKYSALYL